MKQNRKSRAVPYRSAKVASTGSKVLITSAALRDLALKEAASPDGLHYRGITERMLERSWSDLFTKKERTVIAHYERLKETCIGLQKSKYTVVE